MAKTFTPVTEYDRAGFKYRAKSLFKANEGAYITAALLSLLPLLGTAVSLFVTLKFPLDAPSGAALGGMLLYRLASFLRSQALGFAVAMIFAPLTLGVTRYFLNAVKKSAAAEPGDIFYYYKNELKRALGFYARLQLRYIAIASINLGYTLVSVLFAYSGMRVTPTSSFMLGLFLLILSAVNIIATLRLQLTYFFAAAFFTDSPDRSPKQVFELCWQAAWARRWQMFVFGLSFMGWFLLAGITVLIAGVMYVIPYYQLSYSYYFISVKHQVIKRQKPFEE